MRTLTVEFLGLSEAVTRATHDSLHCNAFLCCARFKFHLKENLYEL